MFKNFLIPLLVAVLAGVILLYLERNTNIFDPIKINPPIIHEVKEGETLSGIAAHHTISFNNVIRDNGLKKEAVRYTAWEKKYKKVKDKRGRVRTFFQTVPVIYLTPSSFGHEN